jgi:uncharacterized protein YjbI with pentapeptide repeats
VLKAGQAKLNKSDLSGADLSKADLSNAILSGAYLAEPNLSGEPPRSNPPRSKPPGALLMETDVRDAVLTGCHVYGVSAWNVKLSEATIQHDLIAATVRNAALISELLTRTATWP